MAEAAIGAGVASVAGLALSAGSSVMKGEGEQAAANFKAAQAERAADFGRMQASLTDTDYRERLNTTLANIEVIRAPELPEHDRRRGSQSRSVRAAANRRRRYQQGADRREPRRGTVPARVRGVCA